MREVRITNRKLLSIVSILFVILGCLDDAVSQGIWSTDTTAEFIANSYNASSVLDGRIYVMPGDFASELQVFDPLTHTWSTPATTGAFMTEQHYLPASIALNGKIYVLGGSNGLFTSKSSVSRVYDPAIRLWSVLKPTGIFTPRDGLTASVVDSKIYVIGGDTSWVTPVNILEIYDPSTNAWSTPATTGTFTPRSDLTSCVVDGKIYVIGGWDHTANELSTLEVFDPSTMNWSSPVTTGIFTPRHLMTSAVVNGKIYVFGGSLSDHIAPCNILEVFDPATNKWSTPITAGIFTPRFALSSGVVSGKIYTLGGFTPHTELNSNEVFTPGTSQVQPGEAFQEIMLSPNPTTGFITVHNPPVNIVHVTVSNILGERIVEIAYPNALEFTLDLSKVSPGIYLARFSLPIDVITRMIIKE